MNMQDVLFVKNFQKDLVLPAREALNLEESTWMGNPGAEVIAQLIKTLNVEHHRYTKFQISYVVFNDFVSASNLKPEPLHRLEHCLWEVYSYLEQKKYLSAFSDVKRINLLRYGIYHLLQINFPSKY